MLDHVAKPIVPAGITLRMISILAFVTVVLSLPTMGPLFLTAIQQQDPYLAGFIVLMLGLLTVIGTLVSDMLLAVVGPRIRLTTS